MPQEFEYDVFLSFATPDESTARQLWEQLTLAGLRVFWADSTLKDKVGESWYAIIQESLLRSRHCILLWTDEAKKSRFVRREYQVFDSECAHPPDRLLIPVLGPGVTEKSLPVFLRQIQSYFLVQEEDRSRLIKRLGGRVGGVEQENVRLRDEIAAFEEEVATLKEKGKPDADPAPGDWRAALKRRLGQVHVPSVAAGAVVASVLAVVLFSLSKSSGDIPPWSDWPTQITTADSIEFVLVLPGSFRMGSAYGEDNEQPARAVELTRPYYIGRYEVTRGEWETVMDTVPANPLAGALHPVSNISWEEVQVFLDSLNENDRAYRYRLPTEAEWEYVARAGSDTTYFWGGDQSRMDDFAVCEGSVSFPVGSRAPTRHGVYDVLGNVWEWTADWAGPYEAGDAVDPRGPRDGTLRVVRGGSFGGNPDNCRSARRLAFEPDKNYRQVGFRIAAVPAE